MPSKPLNIHFLSLPVQINALLVAALTVFFITFSAPEAYAQLEEDAIQAEVIPEEVTDKLTFLVNNIAQQKKILRDIDDELDKAELEVDFERILVKRKKEQKQLNEQLYSFEKIATGSVDLSIFEDEVNEEFSWQQELKEILQPIFSGLKQLTERPRQIDGLRNEQESLQVRIEAADIAIDKIEILAVSVDSKAIKNTLDNLLARWYERKEELASEKQLVDFQLDEKLLSSESTSSLITGALKDFFTGRGLNLLLAFLAFVITFFLLRYMSHLLERRISRGQDKEKRFAARLVHVVFQVLTVFLSLLALMLTLYVLSDWLVLTLLVIVLVGIVFALRNSLPRYVDEVRLLLNVGSVREGERVIYNGLPWRVSRLNIFSDLVNPSLTGGRLRLPMNEMLSLISRRWSRDEPWFPCKPDDFVILTDDTYGRVLLQTPDQVQIEARGGSTMTYNTLDFLAQSPRNLSDGFGVFVTFGLDYEMQADITGSLLSVIQSGVKEYLGQQEYGQSLEILKVEFDEAAASSLNVKVIAIFAGEAAMFYYPIPRAIQTSIVNICNQQHWNIPFSQLTVHMEAQNQLTVGSAD